MSEVETSSMAKPESTKKKKKNYKSTEPARIVTTVRDFQIREVKLRFARFTEFYIYINF